MQTCWKSSEAMQIHAQIIECITKKMRFSSFDMNFENQNYSTTATRKRNRQFKEFGEALRVTTVAFSVVKEAADMTAVHEEEETRKFVRMSTKIDIYTKGRSGKLINDGVIITTLVA
nr:hypothetical protein [Tanacetum cinerariifolium]